MCSWADQIKLLICSLYFSYVWDISIELLIRRYLLDSLSEFFTEQHHYTYSSQSPVWTFQHVSLPHSHIRRAKERVCSSPYLPESFLKLTLLAYNHISFLVNKTIQNYFYLQYSETDLMKPLLKSAICRYCCWPPMSFRSLIFFFFYTWLISEQNWK